MRYSQTLIPTRKETPVDAELPSHQLMLRAGYIEQLTAGIYTLMPLAWRSVQKIEKIVREELNRAGAQEILLPMVQPAEIWKLSGRWDHYGKELLRFKDRKDQEYCLSGNKSPYSPRFLHGSAYKNEQCHENCEKRKSHPRLKFLLT